ncbi:hypothetical protein CXG81DRAFT_9379 [Caulochytrium protostelioides]|uniref:Mitochondrial fission 1 protein n=1 Tax=Caulochytrium protostelioides TaxID=1555241 RepID=A0A4P9WVH2_9FUNG|nr:mitochondrial fission 1 protein [Caulochytrium protostelioides]RKP03593.1 hypothetical protein CXG81DRAFT_9379 [Caulochytrium protostelioides]|eukprot:RKP03593.1 hypothetical protein CXG81DRAFT_9379 [Caulochytrium protostelioides]
MESLPYASEAERALSRDEFNALKQQFVREQGGEVRPQTKFNYAWALVRSRARHDQEEGIRFFHEIYRENPQRRRECLYYLALGQYKLGNYREARRFNETLLQIEQANPQALSLRRLIDEKVRADGLVGMAIVGGVVATAGVIAAAIFGSRRG